MAILHGSWLVQPEWFSPLQAQSGMTSSAQQSRSAVGANQEQQSQTGQFFIWGEVWRRVDPVVPTPGEGLAHPYAMTASELIDLLRSLSTQQSIGLPKSLSLDEIQPPQSNSAEETPKAAGSERWKTGRWKTVAIALPTHTATKSAGRGKKRQVALFPQHSVTIEADSPISPELLQLDAAAATKTSGRSSKSKPSDSVSLYPWQVVGICLSAKEALQLLHSLPLHLDKDEESFLGGDLRFWSHVARWDLDLLARAKYLPILERQSEQCGISRWSVLLDSAADQARLEQYATQMPFLCRAFVGSSSFEGTTSSAPDNDSDKEHKGVETGDRPTDTPLFLDSRPLLFHFLNQTIDAQVRRVTATIPLPTSPLPRDLPLREWLQSLAKVNQLETDGDRIKRLHSVLNTWLAPVQRQLTQKISPFLTSFKLVPPEESGAEWRLEFGLQAIDNRDFWVSADVVWSNPVNLLTLEGRTIEQPQETFLAGLGLASRLYPVLEPSLQEMQPAACVLHPLQVYEFIKSTAWQLQDSGLGVVLPPSLSSRDGWANRLGLAIRAQTPRSKKKQGFGLQSLLNFKWELTIGGQRISKEEFDQLVALNTPLVQINGEWVELREQDIKSAQTFFESRKDQMSLSLEDALRISTGDTQMIEKLPVVDFEASGSLEALLDTLTTGNQNVEDLEAPEGFQGELRPYQNRGVSWLKFLTQWGLGACLADDMGLGKTIQLIALLLHLKAEETLTKPTLLVCPTSVLGNWEREVRRFAPDLRVGIHHGDKRSHGKKFVSDATQKDLVITSYALAFRDEKTLGMVEWQGVVLDEAQNIKNPEAKQSQAVRKLNSDFRIALTGTPIENRLSELWSIIDFLNPGYLGPRNFFQRRFAMPIERYGDTDSLQALRSLVQPFILRRLKTDRSIIQDLPDKQEMTIFCGLTESQAELYQTLVDQSLETIESAEGIQRHGMILALLTRLKQVCNHPALLSSGKDKSAGKGAGKNIKTATETATGTTSKTRAASSRTTRAKASATDTSATLSPTSSGFLALSGKLQRLEEMLDELLAEGDRALIFTQFAEWGKLMKTHLETRFGREVLFLYGSTSREKREAMVDRFQNDPQGPRIFILSLKAGGVGINLTRANHVFHFDRWWNPAVENQATDRAFRIGQTRNVQVHKFVCSGTLEERINELIESKKALSEQVVGTGENWLTEFDSDQLRNLLLLDRSAVITEDSD
ncbi:MAG: DEAD/DEAH box helicase [Elainellaceae cyanobacterium]